MKNRKLPLIAAFFVFSTSLGLYGQDTKSVVKNYLETSSALNKNVQNRAFVVSNEDPSHSLKGTVVKIQQTLNGIPIYGNYATVLVKDNAVVSFNGSFTKNSQANSTKATISQDHIFGVAAGKMGLSNPSHYDSLVSTEQALPAKLVYFDNGSSLVLAYQIEFEEQKSSNMWFVVADANTGNILVKENLTLSCSFHEGHFGRDHSEEIHDKFVLQIGAEKKNGSNINVPFLVNDANYRVYPFPVESPIHGERALLTNPWDLSVSPFGWQKTNTTEFETTRGNNVFAYLDEMSVNPSTGQVSANGGANHNFDFPFSFPENYVNNTNASLTNLFYSNNKVHDIMYKYGFTETAGNFQSHNFGLGGNQNDHVMAESRDGGGVADLSLGIYNNANFSTPSDGFRPKMQMYVWLGAGPYFTYNAPNPGTSIAQIGLGYFGPPLWKAPATADVAISPVEDACTQLPSGSLAGKIGIAKRGTCNFILKVKNMQDAGAIAGIIYDNVTGDPTNMSGDGSTTISIPSVFVTKVNGESIVNTINGGQNVNVSLNIPYYDSGMDHSIVVHEYGHGISNRLTGDSVNCLSTTNSKEQMGEGWSDFFALMLTLKPTDNSSIGRGIGTYAAGQTTTGVGIRPAKYTPNMSENNYTYGKTNGMEYTNSNGQLVPDVHSIGFIWASMLWDLHWKYVEKYGFDADVAANQASGSGKVLQLVIDGLKLQPCAPTFIDGRDAILAADQASNGGADKCMIWNAFARRGLGLNASAGSKTNINDQVEDFTVPVECALAANEVGTVKGMSIFPNPAKNEFNLKFSGNITGKVKVDIFDTSGRLVSSQNVDPKGTETIGIQNLSNGVYVVKASGIGVESSTKLIVNK